MNQTTSILCSQKKFRFHPYFPVAPKVELFDLYKKNKARFYQKLKSLKTSFHKDHILERFNHKGRTILHIACTNRDKKAVQILLDLGANARTRDLSKRGIFPLYLAAENNDIEIVKLLTNADPSMVHIATLCSGFTPLHIAATLGHTQVASILLEHGALPTCSSITNHSPLFYAAFQGHLSMVELIVSKCQNRQEVIDQKCGENNLTPLHIATLKGYDRIVSVLLENGANYASKNSFGDTPLHLAVYIGNAQLVKELITPREKNPHVSLAILIKNTLGNYPLEIAANQGDLEITRMLL